MTQHVSHYHSDQIRELHAEIERLKEQVAAAQASSGYTICVAQVEIERLTALVAQQSRKHDADMQAMQLAHNREIERLRLKVPDRDKLLAEIDRLTAVLRYIIEIDDPSEAPILARRALEPKP